MTKVSRWKLGDKKEKELLNQLWTAITLLEDKREVIDFLKAILTNTESLMLAKRIALVKLHEEGVSLGDIRKLLHITKVTSYKWQERLDLYYKEFKVIIDRLRELETKQVGKQSEREKHFADRKKYSLLTGLIGTSLYLTEKKVKKIHKRRSARY